MEDELLITDIDARKRAEAMLAGENRLLEMVARGLPLPIVLETLCGLVETCAPDCLCGVMLTDLSGTTFVHGAAPSLPFSYKAMIDGRPISADFPLGKAAISKTPVVVADIAADPAWAASDWSAIALAHGLRACWPTPILSTDQKVHGVLTLYRREPGTPTPVQLDLIDQMTQLASIGIERAQGEAALKRSEVRKAAMLDAALDGIVTIDHEGRITEFNPAAERIFGFRRDDVVGKELAEVLIPEAYRERHRRGMARYLATGEATLLGTRVEMTALCEDGREIPVELAVTRIPLDGPPLFTGYVRDITERKQAEENLRRNEVLRSELAHVARISSLGTLTASIAHEVNQPLSGIITNASTCLRMLAADPPNVEGARETAQRTIRDGRRAADVIARLRALFTKKEPTIEAMDLNEATREVIALSSSDLQRGRVVLQSELLDDLPLVTGDRVQLQQVIQNLLRNASDAMSTIEDRPRQLFIKTARDEDEQDRVRLSVQDVGIGFDRATVDRLFEAFYSTKPDGMGIGLSVSRSIIESHHGRLWATLNDGPGATFAFSLPCASNVTADVRQAEP
jgi:PAS domain S-box-containing protein